MTSFGADDTTHTLYIGVQVRTSMYVARLQLHWPVARYSVCARLYTYCTSSSHPHVHAESKVIASKPCGLHNSIFIIQHTYVTGTIIVATNFRYWILDIPHLVGINVRNLTYLNI